MHACIFVCPSISSRCIYICTYIVYTDICTYAQHTYKHTIPTYMWTYKNVYMCTYPHPARLHTLTYTHTHTHTHRHTCTHKGRVKHTLTHAGQWNTQAQTASTENPFSTLPQVSHPWDTILKMARCPSTELLQTTDSKVAMLLVLQASTTAITTLPPPCHPPSPWQQPTCGTPATTWARPAVAPRCTAHSGCVAWRSGNERNGDTRAVEGGVP